MTTYFLRISINVYLGKYAKLFDTKFEIVVILRFVIVMVLPINVQHVSIFEMKYFQIQIQ